MKTSAPAADIRGGEGTGGADMDFSQFNLMGYRVPGTPAHRLYDEAVEQVRAAEAAGFIEPALEPVAQSRAIMQILHI